MNYLLDTSALLAHYFGEPGAERIQAMFEDAATSFGTTNLVLFEFEWRLHVIGLSEAERKQAVCKYQILFDEILDVTAAVCAKAVFLRAKASDRLSAMDALIAATASMQNATLIHRDAHFTAIPSSLLKQELLPPK